LTVEQLKQIPAFKYYFPPEMVDSIVSDIRRLLESGDYLTLGRYTEQFEKEYAVYVGTKHAIAMASGTSSLEAILRAINVKGREVIVPTNTFAATAFAVIHAGGRPVFSDIERDLSFDPEDMKKKLNSNTSAIIAVHIGGFISSAFEELRKFAQEKGIPLVEDAAHAQGSMTQGKKAGNLSEAAGFSFFSTKVITSGEGGMITTNNDEVARAVRLLRDQGKVSGNSVGILGYNWRMSEFQSVVGLAQLRRIEEIISKRMKIAERYDRDLSNLSAIQCLYPPKQSRPNFYKYILFLHSGRHPEDLRQLMKKKFGISLSGYVYEAPLHSQKVFADYINGNDRYPVADDLCYRHVCLPLYPQMTVDDADYVANSLVDALKELGWA